MSTNITINAEEITEEIVAALTAKFGRAKININIEADDRDVPTLAEKDAWELIESINWKAVSEQEALQPLVNQLSTYPISHIYLFQDWLTKKLWLLDTPAHANNRRVSNNYLSVDDFLYARCAVIAEGQEFYEDVLNQPYLMPVEVSLEGILYVSSEAYLIKTGKEMVEFSPLSYETYANREAWADHED